MALLKSYAFWIAAYAVLIALVLGGLFSARAAMLAALATPEAQAAWEAWREEAKAVSGADERPVAGPVQRRVPKSVEPPALVLLRDHFGTCVAGGLLFSSLLFFALMFAARGVALQAEEPPQGERPAGSPR